MGPGDHGDESAAHVEDRPHLGGPHAPELGDRTITIDAAYVDRMLADIAKSDDLSRYIL